MLDIRPLHFRTFRYLAAAYSLNELGNWIGDVALAILVFNGTGSPLATAALFLALRFVPGLLAPLFTTLIEAISARAVLPAIYLGEGAIFAALALLAGHFLLAVVLVLCAIDGMIAIAAKALTRSATVAELKPHGLLREGNAIINVGFTVGGAVGPALAGVLVATSGAGAALWVDAGSFLAVAVVLASARDLRIESDREVGAVGRLRAGLAELHERPNTRRLMAALAFVLMFGAVAVPIEVVFAKRTLHAGDSGYGLLLGAWGIGMILGALAFASAARMRPQHVLALATIAIALGYGGLALSPDLLVACIFSALGGLGNGIGSVAAVNTVQHAISTTAQSAVMAVMQTINQMMPAAGFVLGGAITALSSPRAAYAVSAVGVALVLLIVSLRPFGEPDLPTIAGEPTGMRANPG